MEFISKPLNIVVMVAVLLILGIAFMGLFGLCPPKGPWPVPPWCTKLSEEKVEKIEDVVQKQIEKLKPKPKEEFWKPFEQQKPPVAKIIFIVKVPDCTPKGEPICLHIDLGRSIVMDYNGQNIWVKELDFNIGTWRYSYAFSRACLGYETSEVVDINDSKYWWSKHKFVADGDKVIRHTVKEWRWYPCGVTMHETFTNRPKFMEREIFMDGASLIDFWWDWVFPVPDCNILPNTARRLSELGDYVNIFSVYTIEFDDSNIKVIKDGRVGYAYSEDNIRQEIRAMKKAGLTVNLLNTIWQEVDSEEYEKERSEEWWKQYNKELHDYLTSIARLAEEEGVNMMQVGYGSDSFLGFIEYTRHHPDYVMENWIKTIREVRKIFHGKLIYTYVLAGMADDPVFSRLDMLEPVIREVDYVGISWWKGVTNNEDASLEELIDGISYQLDTHIKPIYEKTGKKILLIPNIPSAKGGFTGKYKHDSPTVSPWRLPDDVPNDLNGQARFYEALMRVVAKRPWIIGVMPWGYWRAELIDKSGNIRGKPAEKILKEWFDLIKKQRS